MIDIGKILKRAWHILWNYKVLWIFGILLVITGGSAGSSNGGSSSGSNSSYRINGGNGYQGVTPSTNPTVQQLNVWFQQNIEPLVLHPEKYVSTFIWIGVGLLLFFLILGALFAIVRYVSEAAIIRMVDDYEQTGTKVGFKQGWKLGWSRRAFRMWLIDLITGLPFLLLVAIMVGLGVAVYFSTTSTNHTAAATGVVAAIGCLFIFILAFILLGVLLGLLRHFFVRTAALENTGVGDSFRQGWDLFKRNWKSGALMWLVMLGIGIGFGIASLLIFVLLIPVYVVLALPAVIVAAIPGLAVFGITSIFASGPLAWILGILVALPFFLTVVFAPLTLVSAWYAIYESNVWTLTYREIKALDKVAPVELPALAK
jgi:hypothetical protein